MIEPGETNPSGVPGEAECPRDHGDMESYPCHVCGADV
jgi:hypothetical protein